MQSNLPPDHREWKCNICGKTEVMHKFDRFCKKCKKGGKAKENKTYKVELP